MEQITIIVKFIVNKEGKLVDSVVIKGKNEEINHQLIKLLKNSPLWIPGELKGEKVNIKMTYPIRIKPQ